MNTTIDIKDVVVTDRVRKDMGNIAELAASIKTHGLIQPVVLAQVDGHIELSAGGRRLTALKLLGQQTLEHGTHFVWLDERNDDAYARKSVELEENIRRQSLTWQEEVAAKQALLELMQLRYGVAKAGNPTIAARAAASSSPGVVNAATGFGVNKLAAMLGESAGQTSKDLQVAQIMAKVPQLAKASTKEAAFRLMKIATQVLTMRKQASPTSSNNDKWKLYEGDFRANAAQVADASVDLVMTDLPYNASIENMSTKGGFGTLTFVDKLDTKILDDVARESYRVLRDDRFAVFFFGFNFYKELIDALTNAWFNPNIVPAVWVRGPQGNENPHKRYTTCYDPIIVAGKGSPSFIRQGRSNVMSFPAVTQGARMRIAEKPVPLLQDIMHDIIAPGAVVVDWMAGAGSTGEAALKFGASCVLFEIDTAACTIIRAKLGAL